MATREEKLSILLIGDYSMLHKNLKEGLERLGHKVYLLSDGDGWKKLPGSNARLIPDIKPLGKSRLLRSFYYRIQRPVTILKYYHDVFKNAHYDIVQVISADLFFFGERKKIYRYILHKCKAGLFTVLPGDDGYVYDTWKQGKYRYMSFDDNPAKVRRFDRISKSSRIEDDAYRYTINHSKALVPVCPYEGEIPYEGLENLRGYIPLPIDADSFRYGENTVKNGKIVIYHGINHDGNKGTSYILEAMEEIQKKYPDKVECVCTEQIAWDEFLQKLKSCNIYLDQCKSYSYGMAALTAMALGKVIMSGKEPEVVNRIGREDCPVINIIPNKDQIVEELEKLVLNPQLINLLGKQGREFVEDYHDCEKVALQYLKEWSREA